MDTATQTILDTTTPETLFPETTTPATADAVTVEAMRVETVTADTESQLLATTAATATADSPREIGDIGITIRPAVMGDIPFMDSLQKLHTKQVGWMPTKQFEGKIALGHVLIAEESGTGTRDWGLVKRPGLCLLPQSLVPSPQSRPPWVISSATTNTSNATTSASSTR